LVEHRPKIASKIGKENPFEKKQVLEKGIPNPTREKKSLV